MIHARRVRLRELERQEAIAGGPIWTSTFYGPCRERLLAVLDGYLSNQGKIDAASATQKAFREELGFNPEIRTWEQFAHKLTVGFEDPLLPSLVEAALLPFDEAAQAELAELLNVVLAESRVSFELISGQMIEFESRELHQEIVAPALRLLGGLTGWEAVEAAYQDALHELSDGKAADAITDAGTALQEALQRAGAKGDALGPLIKSARNLGLLASHDANLTDGIVKILDWVSADRSQMGDGHNVTGATRDDAWLAVHVVGALILRVAHGARSPG